MCPRKDLQLSVAGDGSPSFFMNGYAFLHPGSSHRMGESDSIPQAGGNASVSDDEISTDFRLIPHLSL